jgi:hypothetical protein
MDAFLWLTLPLFVSAGSALLCYFIMQSRMDAALAKEREALAEVQAKLRSQQVTMEDKIRATQEEARRKAMEEFMQEFRVEERSYLRESRNEVSSKKSMVLQERLFFKNLPLSNWIEHEMIVEESGNNLPSLPAPNSVFTAKQLGEESEGALSRLLETFTGPKPSFQPTPAGD